MTSFKKSILDTMTIIFVLVNVTLFYGLIEIQTRQDINIKIDNIVFREDTVRSYSPIRVCSGDVVKIIYDPTLLSGLSVRLVQASMTTLRRDEFTIKSIHKVRNNTVDQLSVKYVIPFIVEESADYQLVSKIVYYYRYNILNLLFPSVTYTDPINIKVNSANDCKSR